MNKIKLTFKRITGLLIVLTIAFGAFQPYQTQAMQTVPTNSIRYIRDYINGSTANVFNWWMEIEANLANGTNVALNKPVSSDFSPVIDGGNKELNIATNGDHESFEDTGIDDGKLHYIQVDLQSQYSIDNIKIWHWHASTEQPRTFHHNKTQVSIDGIHWTTLFDSDLDGEYAESSAGHTVRVLSLNLTATASPQTNIINLCWKNSDSSQPYSYMLYSKNGSESEFQSIPAKSDIKVLNVYPDQQVDGNGDPSATTTFTSAYDGKNYTVPASGLLKMWMEKANSEDSKGYGRGHIKVDTTPISHFNYYPDSTIQNADGTYKYDVIFFGAWDCNCCQDLSSYSYDTITKFIKAGRGVLIGHDTAGNPGTPHTYFMNLVEKNARMYTWQSGFDTSAHQSAGTTVVLRKKGLLNNYPWHIGDVGSELNVPESHANNLTWGDVWLSYKGCENNDNLTYKGQAGTSNYYLMTWNNLAAIQTGHSNGSATPDEQKILANTLFYLAQVTSTTSWQDHKGQDLAVPNKPSVSSVTHNAARTQYTINCSAADNGTDYQYYVEATSQIDGTKYKSPIASASIKTGVNGYSIVADNNPNTIPNGNVTTTLSSYTFSRPTGSTFYIHIASVDGAGNVSAVTHHKVDELVSITHPINVNYSINPNSSTPFIAADLPITNNSDIPVKVSILSLSSSSGGTVKFNDVLPSKYNDWSKLTAVQTMSDMALGLKVKENVTGAMSWSTISQSGALYAAEITSKQMIGTLNPNGAKGNLALSAKYGLAWDKNTTGQHQLTLQFEAD